jgi:hypothetical protein
MTFKKISDIAYLRNRLLYDPETGKLFWRDYAEMSCSWRAKLAGKEAFTATNRSGYHIGCIDRKGFLSHRVAWAIHFGEWPEGGIDHINGIRDDNRIHNLRVATQKDNSRNAAMPINNTSGVTGVSLHKDTGKWQAKIMVDRRYLHLGLFSDIEEAKAARAAALAKYGFSERHGQYVVPNVIAC